MKNSLKDWLAKAKEEHFAIGAFNVANLEMIKAVTAAAAEKQSPVILEASPGEIEYLGREKFLAMVEDCRQETGMPLFTNLDHGREVGEVEAAINAGFDMVHFDGSDLSREENLKLAGGVLAKAKEKGVLLEIELEKIQNSSQVYEEKASEVQVTGEYTEPKAAAAALAQVPADILAVSVGNLHGIYGTQEELDLVRLAQLAQIPGGFFSLHGGSGVNPEQVKEAIGFGVVKVNINTELRLAFRETLENVLRGSEEIKIYKMMLPVIAAVQKAVEEKIVLLGSQGRVLEIAKIS